MAQARRTQRGDPWVLSQARELGFASDPSSVTIVGTGWPPALVAFLPFMLTPLWLTRNRILIYGPEHSALFKANTSREDPTELLWSGSSADLRWRRAIRWLLRGETPGGEHVFVIDAPSERRKLRGALADRM